MSCKNEERRSPLIMYGIILMFGGAVVATFSQGIVMLHTCCSDSPLLYELTAATIAAAVTIILGFFLFTAKRLWFDYKERGGGQSGKSEDADAKPGNG